MGSLRKKTSTRKLPTNAELFQRRGITHARWKNSAGKTCTAKTTTGKDGSVRLVVEAATYTAKFRNASGRIQETSTKCRDRQAAASVLAELERDVDRQKAGIVTPKEFAAIDHASKPLGEHFDAYSAARLAEGISERQRHDSRQLIEKVCKECSFATLAAVQRHTVEGWLASLAEGGTGPRRRNIYLEAFHAFLRWAISSNRILDDPLEGIARADQTVDIRKERRPLGDGEFRDLLIATLLRPLAEYGRETVTLAPKEGKRSNWTYAPLTLANIHDAVTRAEERLRDNPELIAKKRQLGRERSLIIQVLSLTGLRRGEVASLCLRNLHLDASPPYIKLDRKSEKNRQGNSVLLRDDLADSLRQWILDRDATAHEASIDAPSLRFEDEAARLRRGESQPSVTSLPPDTLLFRVPDRHAFVKIIDKDFAVAGIPKIDDNGLSVDVHCLRHSFATWIGESGISPKAAQKLMRHSDVNLTMRYTHSDQGTELRALDSLPQTSSRERPDQTSVTGTDGDFKTAPLFAPDSVHQGQLVTFPVNSGKINGLSDEPDLARKRPENPVNKAFLAILQSTPGRSRRSAKT